MDVLWRHDRQDGGGLVRRELKKPKGRRRDALTRGEGRPWFCEWLSRFKLIRLRRISLATLPTYGRMDGYQYIYIACLRQVVAFAPKVIIACLRQVVAFAPKVIKCAAYGVAS